MGRGRRGRAAVAHGNVLLGCPAIAPDWELQAIQALIKPQLAGPIRYRKGEQRWAKRSRALAIEAARAYEGALQRVSGLSSASLLPTLEFPAAGDYRLVMRVPTEDRDLARGLAVVLSRQLRGLWFVVDKLFVLDGRFYRRQYGYKLNLTEATNIHLPRPIRAAVQSALRALKPAVA